MHPRILREAVEPYLSDRGGPWPEWVASAVEAVDAFHNGELLYEDVKRMLDFCSRALFGVSQTAADREVKAKSICVAMQLGGWPAVEAIMREVAS